MKITLPYVYKANVKPPKARKFISEYFGGHIDIEFKEPSSEEAPLALEWTSTAEVGNSAERMMGRVFDGKFYAAMKQDGGYLEASALSSDMFHDFHEGLRWFGNESPFRRFASGELTASISDYKEIEHNEEADVRKALRESAADLIVVDGIVYCPYPVPVIRATVYWGRGTNMSGAEVALEVCADSTLYCSSALIQYFSIQDMDEARDWAVTLDREIMDGAAHLCDQMGAIVYRSDLLPRPDHLVADLRRVTSIIIDMAGRRLNEKPDDYIDAWQGLRRAHAALYENCDPGIVDHAMRAWRELLDIHDEIEEADRTRLDAEYRPEQQIGRQMFSMFLPRWDGWEVEVKIHREAAMEVPS